MARRNPFSRYWLALHKARREVGARTDDRAQISKPPPSYGSPQSDHGSAACAETDAFFQHGPLQPFFEFNSAGRPATSTRAGRKFLSPPLLWLAPPSDRGSAARALKLKLEAVFQYGPPQSDDGGGRLTPRCSIGAGGCAESILDQGNPKPGKG